MKKNDKAYRILEDVYFEFYPMFKVQFYAWILVRIQVQHQR
jgi:hypothetical protein